MIVEDTWGMMNWLNTFIEENKVDWERRRAVDDQENEYKKWIEMEEEEMIAILIDTEKKEEESKETKKDRAARRKGYWKGWRKKENVPEMEQNPQDPAEYELEKDQNPQEPAKGDAGA